MAWLAGFNTSTANIKCTFCSSCIYIKDIIKVVIQKRATHFASISYDQIEVAYSHFCNWMKIWLADTLFYEWDHQEAS